jgi:ABC-2 type transport system permease protein
MGLSTDETIKSQIQKVNEDILLLERGLNRLVLDSIRKASERFDLLNYRSYKVSGSELKEDNKSLAYAIGFASGSIIYITLFVYGASVMRGVMEEKTNRIAEVIVSSVKPFQLMLGKIIGIAAVGLTQLLLWIGVLVLLSSLSSIFLPQELLQNTQQTNEAMPSMVQNQAMALKAAEVRDIVLSANWPLIIGCFLFYFMGGYLFYAALFAEMPHYLSGNLRCHVGTSIRYAFKHLTEIHLEALLIDVAHSTELKCFEYGVRIVFDRIHDNRCIWIQLQDPLNGF